MSQMSESFDVSSGCKVVLLKHLSLSSSFSLEFKFRPVSIYLQPLVYVVYLFMQIFGGKLRPVAVSRSTLVYLYRTKRPVSI